MSPACLGTDLVLRTPEEHLRYLLACADRWEKVEHAPDQADRVRRMALEFARTRGLEIPTER